MCVEEGGWGGGWAEIRCEIGPVIESLRARPRQTSRGPRPTSRSDSPHLDRMVRAALDVLRLEHLGEGALPLLRHEPVLAHRGSIFGKPPGKRSKKGSQISCRFDGSFPKTHTAVYVIGGSLVLVFGAGAPGRRGACGRLPRKDASSPGLVPVQVPADHPGPPCTGARGPGARSALSRDGRVLNPTTRISS